MVQAVKVRGEFLVNTTMGHDQGTPSTAGLENGRVVIAWNDINAGPGGYFGGVKIQIIDQDGTKVGSEILVSRQNLSNQYYPNVEAISGGRFVVTWADLNERLGASYLGSNIKAQIFDSNGNKIGSEIFVTDVLDKNINKIDGPNAITALSNGGFVISWPENDQNNSVSAQIFDSNGSKNGEKITVGIDSYRQESSVVGLDDGKFLILGVFRDPNTLTANVEVRVFSRTGAQIGNDIFITNDTINSASALSAVALTGGGFVVSWSSGSGDISGALQKLHDVKAQVFDSLGHQVGPQIQVNSKNYLFQWQNSITSLSNGGFVIAWQDNSARYEDRDQGAIKAQVFDADGVKQGDEFLVNTYTKGNQSFPSVTSLSNGGFMVSWQETSGALGDPGQGIAAQIYRLVDEGVSIYTEMTGDDGKNTLTGNGNDDHISGKGGSDTLAGLRGNDLLDGGAGSDKMAGGLDDDAYVVDASGDKVVENAGEGFDTIQTTLAKYTLGKNVENLTFIDSAAHKGTGNTLDNHLIGGAGNDVLDGKVGADVLEGGLGNDTYYVDNGSDVVIEVAGIGIDSVIATYSYTLSADIENLTLKSGKNANFAIGNASNNLLVGNSIANELYGYGGNDTLYGGKGNDTLSGGDGADTFVLDTAPSARSNLDTVTDFVSGSDTLVFDKTVFKAFTTIGVIGADAFWSGASVDAAHDADDRLIYNTTTGALFYDADGNGTGKAVQVAVLDGHPDLAFSDILIVA